MDATELLCADHRQVERLFGQYEKKRKSPSVTAEICIELTVHSAIEEKLIYPALGAEVSGGARLERHAESEHQQVKDAIFEIERAGYGTDEADRWMRRVIKAVTEHVREEESEIFPRMRKELGAQRLTQLGKELTALKAELMKEAKTAGALFSLSKGKLYELAKARDVSGRSGMTKSQLISALRHN
jgi:hemerythrin superfamily protein